MSCSLKKRKWSRLFALEDEKNYPECSKPIHCSNQIKLRSLLHYSSFTKLT